MNKTIKWLLICIAGAGILFGVVIVSLPFIIDPNDYKDQISKVVHKQTGRVLSIPGDIKLQVSPKLDVSFSLGKIQLASSDAFPDTSFLSSELAEIKLAIWPLIKERRLQVNTIALRGVQLNLIRNSEGKTNWGDLTGDKAKNNDTSPPSSGKNPDTSPKSDLPEMDIGGISIKDINVQYLDQQAKRSIALHNFNLSIGHLQEDSPFPVKADFDFRLDDNKQSLAATIKTTCDLTIDLSKQHFNIAGLSLNGLFQGEMFPASKLEISLMADAEISIPDEKVSIHKLVVQQGDLKAETTLSMANFKSPAVQGRLAIAEYSPQKHLAQLGIALPKFTSQNVLDRLSVSLNFSLNNDQLEVKKLFIQLDDTKITAEASVANLQQPSYALNLHIDRFDLDRYAIEKNSISSSTRQEVPQKNPGKQQIAVPVQLLRGLTFNTDIKIDTLKAAKLTLTDINVKADGKDGLINLRPFSAQLYDGNLTITGQIDARPDIPQMRLNKRLQGVQLGPLFVDMLGKEEFSGRADINVDVVTRGIDKAALTRNANGKLKLSLSDGKIAKLQILQTIRLAKSLISKEAITSNATSQPTGFATLTASGILTNGVFINNDLQAASDLMKVTGKGKVDFTKEHIDYLLTINLIDRIEREKNTGLVDMGNTPIPYRIKGNFTELQQSAAIEEMVKTKAKELLFDTLDKHFGDGKEREEKSKSDDINSLINKGLKGLFGN